MKQLVSIFLVLFVIFSCLTGFGCSAGQNRSEGTSHSADDQADELSNIVKRTIKLPSLFAAGPAYVGHEGPE